MPDSAAAALVLHSLDLLRRKPRYLGDRRDGYAFSPQCEGDLHSSFDLHECIRNAVSMISEQLSHCGIRLKLQFDQAIQPITGNTNRFEQVILNMLVNSKDAIEEKKKVLKDDFRKSIRIKTCLEDHMIRIFVRDNGIGIREEDLEKVLMPFYSTKQQGHGTGLGLSISYGIIKDMHGTLVIKSKHTIGTTLKITLPVQSVQADYNV